MSLINTLKYHGRSVVLPVNKIKSAVTEVLSDKQFTYITDFGSGTLFWSKWLADEFKCPVNSIDLMYMKETPVYDNKLINTYTDINNIPDAAGSGIFFACDVLHHLDADFCNDLVKHISVKYNIIIIKDIDATHKIMNFCNKLHDKIISNEELQNVYPREIADFLSSCGFRINLQSIPKLWYPHFMLTAIKGENI